MLALLTDHGEPALGAGAAAQLGETPLPNLCQAVLGRQSGQDCRTQKAEPGRSIIEGFLEKEEAFELGLKERETLTRLGWTGISNKKCRAIGRF